MKQLMKMLPTIALLMIAGNTIVSAQYITVTIAGTGTAGYSGDGRPGNQANINGPMDVCIDAAHNVYFVDAGNSRIRKVSATTGIITTVAGGGGSTADGVPATSASLTALTKMCADAAGNLYISTSNKIRKITTGGIITTVAGTGVAGYTADGVLATTAELNGPVGVCVDATGNIYIADAGNNRIRKVTAATGIISTIAGTGTFGTTGDGGPATAATISSANFLCIDDSANVFCANSSTIRKITATTGVINTVCSSSEINGMCTDGHGDIYYVQDSCGCQKFNLATGITTLIANDGIDGYNGDGGNSVIMELNWPSGVCLDPAGNIYVADKSNNRVRKIGILTSAPSFIYGASQQITPCPGYASSLSTPLAVTDLDTSVTETWTVVTSPTIGTLAGFPATAASGGRSGLATPSAATYTPFAGYLTGTDSFVVQVSNGTSSATAKIYVSINAASPGTISGASVVCAGGSTIGLTETVSTGAWNVSNPNATIGTDGRLTGVTAGTDTVKYTLSFCEMTTTHVVTINPLPATAPISGSDTVCVGATTTMSDAVTGGVWTSSYIWDFTIGSSSGIVTGVSYSYGPDQVSYAVSNALGCTATVTKPLTVMAATMAISGGSTICIGASVSLYEEIAGGTWSVSNGHAAITGSGSYVTLTGVTTGLDTVIYTNTNGCGTATAKQVVTINPLVAPGTLSGPGTVCVDAEIVLTPSIPGGSWTDANGDVFAFGDGYVEGWTAGIDTVYYTGVCASSAVAATITVNPLPGGTIAGPAFVCLGATITLTDITSGGTWNADNPNATIVSSGTASAVVTGITLGTDIISYASTNMCGTGTVSKSITIDPVISSSGTVSGPSAVCTGAMIDLITTAPGGTWSATNADASVATSTGIGIVTGMSAGTDTIVYTAACATTNATAVVTVHPSPSVGAISGSDTLCVGATSILSDAVTGGTWSSMNPFTVSVSATGTVTGSHFGSGSIRYTTSNAWCTAYSSKTLTIYAPASGISGGSVVCLASAISLSDAVPGGTWSATNGNATIVSTGGGSATATGVITGSDTVIYTNTNMCGTASVTQVISVNPPAVAGTISGATSVCIGAATAHYTDTSPGGTWGTSNTTLAHIGPAGYLTALIAGPDTVVYTVNSGCNVAAARYPISVGTYAGTITGPAFVCPGSTITLTDAATGGTWSVGNSSVSVSGAGVVAGVLPGVDTVFYSETNACGTGTTSAIITFYSIPFAAPIGSPADVCAGATITATDISGGGVWSEATGHLSILSSGIITGISMGTDTIKYTLSNSCGSATASRLITINPLPDAGTVVSAASLCAGATTVATDAVAGGLWSAATGHISISVTGGVSAISAGIDTVKYSVTNSCGIATAWQLITINPLPDAGTVVSAASLCTGATAVATDAVAGGLWSAATGHISISVTGGVSAISAGIDTVIYSVTNSCGTATAWQLITINPLPDAGTVVSAASLCAGATAVATDAVAGGLWNTTTGNSTTSASGVITGVTAGLDTISYTVTNTCGAATSTWAITINPLPVAGTITSEAGSVYVGATITVTDAAPGGLWSTSNDDASVSGAGVVAGIVPGIDTVVYTVTNSCGSATTYTIVEITGANTSGITPVNSSSIMVFPNPAASILNIEWTDMPDKTATIVIADVTNRVIWKGYLLNNTGNKGVLELNLSGLSDGVYMLFVNGASAHYTEKVVVSKR